MLVFAWEQNGRFCEETHEARTRTNNNRTDTYHQIQESNPDHSGGRLAFSPLRHPRSEIIAVRGKMIHFSLKHFRHVCP